MGGIIKKCFWNKSCIIFPSNNQGGTMKVFIAPNLMRLMLISTLLLIAIVPLSAKFVQPNQAARAADIWMSSIPNSRQEALGTPSIKSYYAEGFARSRASYDPAQMDLPSLYLLEYDNGSFVLMAAEDNSLPVLGYNANASPKHDSMSPAFSQWVKFYADQIAEIRDSNTLLPQYQQQWAELLSGHYQQEAKNDRAILPLMTTNWNQGWPYNELCPVDSEGPGGHVYAGCVATAMSMVMKYWNHPTTGVGNSSYYAIGYGYQSANFGNTTYLWDEMPDALGSSNIPVATLLYHCGVAVNMDYAPDGSGAQSYDAADAFIDHFRYPQTQIVDRNSYTLANWNNLLKAQIDNGSPIYYSGYGTGGGHAFVIDGYDTADYFHFNFGWSGANNGYYYVTNINPGGSDFNQGQTAIINSIPENYSIANTKVRMHAANATVGDNFLLRITTNPILGTWNVNHYEFNLLYDSQHLSFSGADISSTISAAGTLTVNSTEPGILTVSWDSPTNIVGAGELIRFSFMPNDVGDFLFDLSGMKYNNQPVNNTMYLMVNTQAPVASLDQSRITMQNVMHLGYQQLGTTPLITTYLLPSWNVNHYHFNVNYDSSKLEFVGVNTENTLSSDFNPSFVINSPGSVSISCDASENITGSGNLIKLVFMAIGNVANLSVTQVSLQGFFYNTTQIYSLGFANFILSAYTGIEEELITALPKMRIAPNPSVGYTEFRMESKLDKPVQIAIYNLKGQLVRELSMDSPQQKSVWDTRDARGGKLASGIYFITWKQSVYTGKDKILILN